uniref:ATP synthase subunit a n=1 Tax=Speleketor irwini TaxID=342007 RepID=A0A343QCH8_9NEOP|nr:ATP synthase F0 subunit 6 [Speleketor irwini]ATU07125.1 ATP synthase F0 subunit 6 [Speleketor irwini]
MMMNLFSTFDPSTTLLNLSLNWLSTILPLIFIPLSYWILPSRFNFIWKNILFTLHKEFKLLLGPNQLLGSTLIFVSLFSLILWVNFPGLFPFIFTSSSHLTFTLTFALPLWLSFMIYGWINNTQHMFAHLVPSNTPPVLMPFMVCIETISNIIRPGTLAVRLTANMMAGHLLLTLLGNSAQSISVNLLSLLLMIQILLLILETAVAIIQSYVFSILSTLYSSEVI